MAAASPAKLVKQPAATTSNPGWHIAVSTTHYAQSEGNESNFAFVSPWLPCQPSFCSQRLVPLHCTRTLLVVGLVKRKSQANVYGWGSVLASFSGYCALL